MTTSSAPASSATEPPHSSAPPPLSQAPADVQLAVDLILLLEQHQLAPDLVLRALKMVERDYQQKQAAMAGQVQQDQG